MTRFFFFRSSSSVVVCVVVVVRGIEWVGEDVEVDPPKPETYANLDATKYREWMDSGISTKKRPLFDDIREELVWLQWRDPTCHGQAHAAGALIYKEANGSSCDDRLRSAVSVCDYRCTGGCLHGAFGGYLTALLNGACEATYFNETTSNVVELGNRLLDACRPPGRLSELFGLGECAHAAGHSVVLALGNLAQANASLRFCHSAFYGQERPKSLAHYCATGVVMQLGSKFLKLERDVCDRGVPSSARASCYYYALRAKWNPPIEQACPNREDLSCIFGAASGAMYSKQDRLLGGLQAVRECEKLDQGPSRLACVDGLMFRAGKYFDPNQVDIVCSEFKQANDTQLCLAVARAGMYSMAKEPLISLYQQQSSSNHHRHRPSSSLSTTNDRLDVRTMYSSAFKAEHRSKASAS